MNISRLKKDSGCFVYLEESQSTVRSRKSKQDGKKGGKRYAPEEEDPFALLSCEITGTPAKIQKCLDLIRER